MGVLAVVVVILAILLVFGGCWLLIRWCLKCCRDTRQTIADDIKRSLGGKSTSNVTKTGKLEPDGENPPELLKTISVSSSKKNASEPRERSHSRRDSRGTCGSLTLRGYYA